MRKIEQQMIRAISAAIHNAATSWLTDRYTWTSGNTMVKWVSDKGADVYLHGNLIASGIGGKNPQASFAGWKTRTTASRIAAIMHGFSYAGMVPSIAKSAAIDANRWYQLHTFHPGL